MTIVARPHCHYSGTSPLSLKKMTIAARPHCHSDTRASCINRTPYNGRLRLRCKKTVSFRQRTASSRKKAWFYPSVKKGICWIWKRNSERIWRSSRKAQKSQKIKLKKGILKNENINFRIRRLVTLGTGDIGDVPFLSSFFLTNHNRYDKLIEGRW